MPLIVLEEIEAAFYELTNAKKEEGKKDYKYFQKRALKKKEKRARQKSVMVLVLLHSKMATVHRLM